MTTWRTRIEPFTRPLFFAWSRMSRGMTLGARGVAVDPEGRVLLVTNTASFCGYTYQYEALEKLHDTKAAAGLTAKGG